MAIHSNNYMKRLLFFSLLFTCAFPQIALAADIDIDGLPDSYELFIGTDPYQADTDGDGFDDKTEIEAGFSPRKGFGVRLEDIDTDGDGLNDLQELWFGTSPIEHDTDQDGHLDKEELLFGYNPLSSQADKIIKRVLIVDREQQQLHLEIQGHKMYTFPVSTGNPWTPTPIGEYTIQKKIENKRYVGPGYDLSNVRWNLQFIPMYYIHTAYWHDQFGKRTMSHGCVNMKEEDAAFLYKYMDVGVKVRVIGENPDGGIVG